MSLSEGRGTLNFLLYSLFRQRRHLDRAITHLTRAADRAGPDPLVLGALSNGFLMRYWRTGSLDDLDAAVGRARQSASGAGPERATGLADLGAALCERFLRLGRLADADEAIAACEEALRSDPHPDARSTAHANLAAGRFLRHQVTGSRSDVLAAVEAGRVAVAATSRAHPNHAVRLHLLAQALMARYEYTDHPPDLDEAIDLLVRAVAARHPLDHRRPLYSFNLGEAYRLRFAATGKPSDLDAAVEARELAVREADNDANRAEFLGGLAAILLLRGDLRRAEAAAIEAVETLPAGGLARPMALHNLALIEGRVYDAACGRAALNHGDPAAALNHGDPAAALNHGDPAAALDRGEWAAETAVAELGPGHPFRGAALTQLARLRLRRPDGRPAALADLRAAVRLDGPTLTMQHATQAAILLGELAADAGDRDDALLGFARAASLLPLAAWPGLPRPVREKRLAEVADVAAAAAVFAEPEQALEILELGRSVMWAQHLDLRTDLDRLAEVAPGIAERLAEISAWFQGTGAGLDTEGAIRHD